ncbi:hypothetical protein J7E24_15775 [Hymenobacter sp. ISL-91]|uniref:hypothetical protein n=1 Tax=Hymenobacter sp. ISL-91 TaxID=2819151 RepID=UPI001BE8F4EC|nr:hypothetical protein [Hymenobacter sp. ISL-91]MBT2559247.1 hypothetical protein [Hymenobacter sp. ISL-91]
MPENSKRPAKRRADAAVVRKKNHGSGTAIWVDEETNQMVANAAMNLGKSKSAYVVAAVHYFAEKGLDPTQEQAPGLAEVTEKLASLSIKVDGMQETARKQSADIGNRVVGMWRTLEKNLYTHLATQQSATNLYLEAIEENLLGKLAATESQLLWPLMERVLAGAGNGLIGRRMTAELLKLMGELVPDSKVPYSVRNEFNQELTEMLDRKVVEQSRELLEGLKLTERVRTKRPTVTVAPPSALPPPKQKPATDTPPAYP